MDLSKYSADVADRAITQSNTLLIDAILKHIARSDPEVLSAIIDDALSNVATATSFEAETSVEDLTRILIEGRGKMVISEIDQEKESSSAPDAKD